ncbi:hypothetical protein KIJ96_06860 [Pseudoalteromonas piscicida]|uniref:hypothetical protein n=1 Tax=Pseudoalteromonas piscicida TaxID=43662 RepID=UPI001D09BF29|nr:hypothetical protein [Pseudoalteromonas piscicida]UDM62956.1 hypothetical protein KIJ96_06860 [Pseudoalteromonas piscicida]
MAVCEKKMTPAEHKSAPQKHAKKLEQAIFRATKAVQKPIYELWKSKGFEALGHNSFKDWAKTNQEKFNRSYDSINNDLHTALITVDMCGEDKVGEFSTFSLLPMKPLTKEERKAVYKLARKKSKKLVLEGNDLTNKLVKKCMSELNLLPNKSEAVHEQNHVDEKSEPSPLSAKETMRKKGFNSALNKAESPYFAKRICSAISDAIPKKSTLLICRDLLKEHGCKDAVQEVKKALKQLESK